MEPLYKDKEWLTQKYRVEGLHVNEIAKLAGCTATTVLAHLNKYGVKLWEKGLTAIRPTQEEIESAALPGQMVASLGDEGYPNLFLLYDSEDKMRRFLHRYYDEFYACLLTVSLINQVGNEVSVTRHWYQSDPLARGKENGPTTDVYNITPKVDYQSYISSPEWHQKSREIRERVGKCQVCGWHYYLVAHHNTYETLGEEGPYDIAVLCRVCHGLFHEQSPVIKDKTHRRFPLDNPERA